MTFAYIGLVLPNDYDIRRIRDMTLSYNNMLHTITTTIVKGKHCIGHEAIYLKFN